MINVYLSPPAAKLLGNRTVAMSSLDDFDDIHFLGERYYLMCMYSEGTRQLWS